MASTRTFTMLSRVRPASTGLVKLLSARTTCARAATASFSSSAPLAATPAGPPPSGFRLPRAKRWDESKETALDKASKYFLLAEMLRGMYVVLEQFFRPPYVTSAPTLFYAAERSLWVVLIVNSILATQSTILSKKVPYRPGSAASTPSAVTPQVKNAA